MYSFVVVLSVDLSEARAQNAGSAGCLLVVGLCLYFRIKFVGGACSGDV